MKPLSLKTKIFLDSANPKDTKEAISTLGFLDGQTTNPTLLLQNKEAMGNVLNFYRSSVIKISEMISGSVSIEINANQNTTCEEMFKQARAMNAWLPEYRKRHIKFPITHEGIKAARLALNDGISVNMTLCFSQEQAAAVYAATSGARNGKVFVSPFVGRLDDVGQNGLDLVKNIIRMYKSGDGHVEVLTASVRNFHHFLQAIFIGSDIVTSPLNVLKRWSECGNPMPNESYSVCEDFCSSAVPIQYKEIDLSLFWRDFDIYHPLTNVGLQKFADDWNKLIEK